MGDRKHSMYTEETESAATEALRYQFEVWAARHFGVSDASKTCWAGYRWNTYVGGAYFAHDLQTAWLSWKQATTLAMAAVQEDLAAAVEPARLSKVQHHALESRVPGDLVDGGGVPRGIGFGRAVVAAPPALKVLGSDGYCVGCTCLAEELDPCVWAGASQLVKQGESK